jgi:hypothetical protein
LDDITSILWVRIASESLKNAHPPFDRLLRSLALRDNDICAKRCHLAGDIVAAVREKSLVALRCTLGQVFAFCTIRMREVPIYLCERNWRLSRAHSYRLEEAVGELEGFVPMPLLGKVSRA